MSLRNNQEEMYAQALRVIKDCGGLYNAVMAPFPAECPSVELKALNPYHDAAFIKRLCDHLSLTRFEVKSGVAEFSPSDQFALDMLIQHIAYNYGKDAS